MQQQLEQKQVLFQITDLPLFQYASEVDIFFEYGRCHLRTLEQLEALKEQYQQMYPLANIEGKRAIFQHLQKLSYRISRIKSDGRRFG